MLDKEKAEAKAKELITIFVETPAKERKEVTWELLSYWRLQAMKNQTNENALRLALINMMQKNDPDNNPFVPQKIIDFLKPVIEI